MHKSENYAFNTMFFLVIAVKYIIGKSIISNLIDNVYQKAVVSYTVNINKISI